MKPKKTVFGSKQEHRRFQQLQEKWGDVCTIHHNLPFLNIFEGKDSVSSEEFELLKRTSVDFIVCSKAGRPLAVIEFDGLQNGFNVGTEYMVGPGSRDRKGRRFTLELKLRIAHEANFPFFVLGVDYFKNLGNGLQLSIVDGIIGEVFSSEEKSRRFGDGFDPSQHGFTEDSFGDLSEVERFDLFEDWAVGIEVECDFEHNPIFKEVHELEKTLGTVGFSYWHPNYVGIDPDNWVWVACSVQGKNGRTGSASVRLPNFKTPCCVGLISLAREIGRLLALENLRCS